MPTLRKFVPLTNHSDAILNSAPSKFPGELGALSDGTLIKPPGRWASANKEFDFSNSVYVNTRQAHIVLSNDALEIIAAIEEYHAIFDDLVDAVDEANNKEFTRLHIREHKGATHRQIELLN
ncbi:hypothetical protein N7478_003834 [Penicillium angulare]|uniref:uncharacterized protein n=1 Tax=Penicillium angulare TaxID=116970 RepID=UPI0025402E4D|nr:uncharacterized protein N7478_003834 [Penicillium angulare]KAJ5288148.1 hypothetical protein N7478_003834 [Penicillium angulare]